MKGNTFGLVSIKQNIIFSSIYITYRL